MTHTDFKVSMEKQREQQKNCEHDWRYSNQSRYVNCSHRRVCAKCFKLQVRGYRKEDREKWFDSLGMTMADTNKHLRSLYWDKEEKPYDENHKSDLLAGGISQIVNGEVVELPMENWIISYTEKQKHAV